MIRDEPHTTPVPTKWVGPMKLTGNVVEGDILVPMATYETPLWPSTARGAGVSRHAGGIRCTLVDERMTRSILLRATDAAAAHAAWQAIDANRDTIAEKIAETSRFARLVGLNRQIIGNLDGGRYS